MTPSFFIKVDGNDVTSNFNDRLLEMTVTELDGGEASKLEILLDDRDAAIEVPPKGKQITVGMGFVETGVQELGTFTVTEIELRWAPNEIKVHGKSADFTKPSLKQSRNLNYENKSLSDIAQDVANRAGLGFYADQAFSQSKYTILHQTDESDMHLVTRLAREWDALFTIAGGKLILSQRGNNETSSGQKMEVTVTPDMVKPGSVQVRWPDRTKYDNAGASWYDQDSGERKIERSDG